MSELLAVEGWPVADKATVLEGHKRLLICFEEWVNERADAERPVSHVDGMMVAHNIYKAIMQDLSERIEPETRARLFGVGLRRLAQALLSPEESKQAEQADAVRRATA